MSNWPVSPSAVALDMLADDERIVAEQLIENDPIFAAAVEEQRGLTGLLSAMPAEMRRPEPAPAMRTAQVHAPRERRRWLRWQVLSPLAAGLAAAGIALAFVIGGGSEPAAPGSTTLVFQPVGQVPGMAKLTVEGDRMELVGNGLPPSAQGQHYEAWLAAADGHMKPLGGFRVSADGSVRAGMELHDDLSQYDFIDVSVESAPNPTTHSGKSVLRVQL